MKTHQIVSYLEIPLAISEVFDFFSKADNLESITPPELRFEIVSPKPIEIRQGSIIEYDLRLYGIKFRWRALISEWLPGKRFVDEQVSGPYKLWRHSHEVEQIEGGSIIHDRGHICFAIKSAWRDSISNSSLTVAPDIYLPSTTGYKITGSRSENV